MGTIYKLNFTNNKSYIGKTSNPLDIRLRFHKNNKGMGCPLLKLAYETSEYIGHEVLEDDIPLDLLDSVEQFYIKTMKPELNTLPGGEGLNGLNHPRSKYTKETIEELVHLFLNTSTSYIDISHITGIEYNTVHDICKQRSHAWVWESIDPKLYQIALDLRKAHYRLYDKYNQCYEFSNILKFAKDHSTTNTIITSAISGSNTVSGWSQQPHEELELISPEQETIKTNVFLAKSILQDSGLSKFQINQLLLKGKPSGNWKVNKIKANKN